MQGNNQNDLDAEREEVLRELDRMNDRSSVGKDYEFASLLQRGRDLYEAKGDSDRARHLQWELEAWRLIPVHPWDEDQGGPVFKPMLDYKDGSSWPELEAFTSERVEYLRERAGATANAFIRAHYHDIAWALGRYHTDGRAAFAAYLDFAQFERDEKSEDPRSEIDIQHAFTRPLSIAVELNDPTLLARSLEAVSVRMDDLIRDGELRWFLEIAKSLVHRARRVERPILEQAAIGLDLAAQHFAQQGNELLERSMLETLTKLRCALGDRAESVRSVRERIARSFVAEGARREKDSPMSAASAYRKALIAFQELGGEETELQVSRLETEVKRLHALGRQEQVKLGVPIEIDTSGADRFAEFLLELAPSDDLRFLASADGVFPSVGEIRNTVEGWREDSPLQFVFPHMTMRDDNVVRIASSSEEIFEDIVAETYGHALRISMSLLDDVLRQLVLGKRWHQRPVFRHFRRSPFFEGRDLRLLQHALRRYFARDYLSAVQLLSLQVEPSLRHILQMIGLPTTKTDARTGVTREKNLEEVLATAELSQLLGSEYIYCVRFVLTDQRGILLRHGTAHGLISADLCHSAIANLLVYLLLWMTRFVKADGTVNSPNDAE